MSVGEACGRPIRPSGSTARHQPAFCQHSSPDHFFQKQQSNGSTDNPVTPRDPKQDLESNAKLPVAIFGNDSGRDIVVTRSPVFVTPTSAPPMVVRSNTNNNFKRHPPLKAMSKYTCKSEELPSIRQLNRLSIDNDDLGKRPVISGFHQRNVLLNGVGFFHANASVEPENVDLKPRGYYFRGIGRTSVEKPFVVQPIRAIDTNILTLVPQSLAAKHTPPQRRRSSERTNNAIPVTNGGFVSGMHNGEAKSVKHESSQLKAIVTGAIASKPKSWVSPEEILSVYGPSMTDFEKNEISQYKRIYYYGKCDEKPQLPGTESYNDGFDTKRGDYKVGMQDHIDYRYEITGFIGKGAFGQVLAAIDHKKKRRVAIKIIKNRSALHKQAQIEINTLKYLNRRDPDGSHYTMKVFDDFTFRNHPCIVCEFLGNNLYEVLRENDYKGFPVRLIRSVTKCVLNCLEILGEENMVHCDIKPENVLLVPGDKPEVKLIDFGSSCKEDEQIYNYIQSRYYRAPEVILGLRYTKAIDIWSLGCVIAELLTGTPLLPGEDEAEQLCFIVELLGEPPADLFKKSPDVKKIFGSPRVANAIKTDPATAKTLEDFVGKIDPIFKDFILKCLTWLPEERLTAREALNHPWMRPQKAQKHENDVIICNGSSQPLITTLPERISGRRSQRRVVNSIDEAGHNEAPLKGIGFAWLKPMDLGARCSHVKQVA